MKICLKAVVILAAFSTASSSLDATSTVTAKLFDVASPRTGSATNFSTGDSSQPITFSEFPVTSRITNQYEGKGVVFGPDVAMITNDKSAPMSPVLSGVPKFSGPISGRFVDPKTGKNVTIKSFSFTAGYFDEVASTRVSWFDPDGTVIGQAINQRNGMESIVATGGNIASFRIGVILDEPNGFAIDNFVSLPATSGVLFRERAKGFKDGSWGSNGFTLPGFDHVALNYMGSVYESHPGYDTGPVYISVDGKESANVEVISGVQVEHTLGTFKHSSSKVKTSVVDVQEVAVDDSQARSMTTFIASKVRTAGFATFDTLSEAPPHPDIQKGRNNSFTGCGLVEWAAERAKINGGEGFIPNKLESIMLRNDTFTLLSPQLMYFAMQNQGVINGAIQSIKAFFRRIDYVLTDPLGRRVGFYYGVLYSEIPTVFATPNGDLEYLILFNPLPGDYVLKVHGSSAKGLAAMSVEGSQSFVARTSNSTEEVCILQVPVIVGSRGDVNNDGVINGTDVVELKKKIPVFTNGYLNPGDINGDGVLDAKDVDLLTAYLNRTVHSPIAPPPTLQTKAPSMQSPAISKPTKVPINMQTKAPRLSPIGPPVLPPPTIATSAPMNPPIPTISSPLIPPPNSSVTVAPNVSPALPTAPFSKAPRVAPSTSATSAPKAPQVLPTVPSSKVPLIAPSAATSPPKVPPAVPTVSLSKAPLIAPSAATSPPKVPPVSLSKAPLIAPSAATSPPKVPPVVPTVSLSKAPAIAPSAATSPPKVPPAVVPTVPSSKAPLIAPSAATSPPKVPPVVPTVPSSKAPAIVPSATKAPFSSPSVIISPLNPPSPAPMDSSPSVLVPTTLAVPTVAPHVAPDSGCLQLVVCRGGLFFKYYKMHKTVSVLGRKKCIEKCVFRSKIRKKQRFGWDCGFCP